MIRIEQMLWLECKRHLLISLITQIESLGLNTVEEEN